MENPIKINPKGKAPVKIYSGRNILIAVIVLAITGTIGFASDIVWLQVIAGISFVFLGIRMFYLIIRGLINSWKSDSKAIAVVGGLCLLAFLIWAVLMLLGKI